MRSPFGIRKKLHDLGERLSVSSGMASGSPGAQRLQQKLGSGPQARDFYKNRVFDHVRPHMFEYLARRREVFLATSDSHGDLDCSVKMGVPGFVRVLDPKTVAIPLYAGNGVHSSLGNLSENPRAGLCFFSPQEEILGFQINGSTEIVESGDIAATAYRPAELDDERRFAVRWLIVHVREAYARCNRHRVLVDDEAAEGPEEAPPP